MALIITKMSFETANQKKNKQSSFSLLINLPILFSSITRLVFVPSALDEQALYFSQAEEDVCV